MTASIGDGYVTTMASLHLIVVTSWQTYCQNLDVYNKLHGLNRVEISLKRMEISDQLFPAFTFVKN